MNPENALLSRTAHLVDNGKVCIEEYWDAQSPDCPFVQLDFNKIKAPYVYAYRVMSRQQYEMYFGKDL